MKFSKKLGLRFLLIAITAAATASFGCVREVPEAISSQIQPSAPIAFISVRELYQAIKTGILLRIIDVRDRAAYDHAHIPGALSYPLPILATRYTELPEGTPVIFY